MPVKRDAVERFREKYEVNEQTGCWEWCASFGTAGYGQFGETHSDLMGAHVFAYKTFVGPIPEGYEVHHDKCRNKACVNPDHLSLMLKSLHGAFHMPIKEQCKNGHTYTITGFYTVTNNGKKWRQCAECIRLRGYRLRFRNGFGDVHLASATG